MYLFFVILLGVILRLAYILKPEGLWNDEYVSWMISATPFNDGFITAVLKQCHMPLYYLYLKIFTIIGNNNDLILRLSSVLPSVAAIWIMYFAGKTKNRPPRRSACFELFTWQNWAQKYPGAEKRTGQNAGRTPWEHPFRTDTRDTVRRAGRRGRTPHVQRTLSYRKFFVKSR